MGERTMKNCQDCCQDKPVDQFYKAPGTVDGFHALCKVCYSDKYKKLHRNNQRKRRSTPEGRIQTRVAALKHRDGTITTVEEIQTLEKTQKFNCAICLRPFTMLNRTYHIDHNHSTKKIRGLLCGTCNTLMGCIDKHDINPEQITRYMSQ